MKKLLDHRILIHLLELNLLQKAEHILIYYPIHHEVDLLTLTKNCNPEQNFYLPAIEHQKMEARKLCNQQELIKGQYGIMVPPNTAPLFPAKKLNLIIVPGLAFNENCYRLGYGKGYYDQFLSKLSAIKIGVGYDFQIDNSFIPEAHDEALDYIVTESRTIKKHD